MTRRQERYPEIHQKRNILVARCPPRRVRFVIIREFPNADEKSPWSGTAGLIRPQTKVGVIALLGSGLARLREVLHALHLENCLLRSARGRTCHTGAGSLAGDLYFVADMVFEFGCIARELIVRSVVKGEFVVATRSREAPFNGHVSRSCCRTLRRLGLWISL